MVSHEKFLELCAVSISSELTEEERVELEEHLKGCSSCREVLEQFKASVKAVIPAVAEHGAEHGVDPDPVFSVEKAEAAFFSRFDREGGFDRLEPKKQLAAGAFDADKQGSRRPAGAGWEQLWMPLAAILVLCVTLGIASYRLGMKKGVETAGTPRQETTTQVSLEEKLSDAGHERQQLLGEIAARDQTIAQLTKQVREQPAAAQQQKPATSFNESNAGALAVAASAAKLEALQKQLDAEEQARAQQVTRANQLEAKVADLTKQLQESGMTVAQQKRQLEEREAALNQQEELLEHDRDIRDLMGARKLYVVDVYDVEGSGTSKPYGRIFYTQGKSLIFYAYDLDQAPGLRKASTFQAWGRRGPNKDHALNLGVFYEDNVANKRWVVKFDDPKSLAQIDAVFVTIEPDTHSNTPRGKQVLFAYLRVDPNHP